MKRKHRVASTKLTFRSKQNVTISVTNEYMNTIFAVTVWRMKIEKRGNSREPSDIFIGPKNIFDS